MEARAEVSSSATALLVVGVGWSIDKDGCSEGRQQHHEQMNYRGNDDKHNRVSRNGLCGVHEMALSVDAFADVAMRWVLLHAWHPQFLVLRLRAPLGSLPSRPEIKDSGKMEITR